MKKSEIFGVLTSDKSDAKQKERAYRKLIRRYGGKYKDLNSICYAYVPINEPVIWDHCVKIKYDPDKNICYYNDFYGTYAECREHIRKRIREIKSIIKSDPKFTDYMGLHVDPILARILDKGVKLEKMTMDGKTSWSTATVYGDEIIIHSDKIIIPSGMGDTYLRKKGVILTRRGGWVQKRNVTKYYYYDDSTGTSKLIEIDGRHREKSLFIKLDEKRIVDINDYGLEIGYLYKDVPGNYVIKR